MANLPSMLDNQGRTMTKIVDVLAQINQAVDAHVVSIGLVLDNGQVGWGDCVDLENDGDLLSSMVTRYVKPLLTGRVLGSFRELSAEIDALTETITLVETIHHPPPPPKEGVSRRSMFRLDWQPEQPPAPPPEIREYEESRPILRTVCYGATQALLSALALAKRQSICEILRHDYAFPVATATVPTLPFLFVRQLNSAKRMLAYRPGALGLALASTDYDAEMGKSGVVLSNAVQRLKTDALALAPPNKFSPTFYYRVYGGYGTQNNNSVGKVLGQLFTLSKKANPFTLWIEDAIIGDDFEQHIKLNKQLCKLANLRKMTSLLVAKYYVDSLDRVRDVIEHQLAHAVYLDPMLLGGVGTMIEALKLCRAANLDVIWGGHSAETALSASITSQVVMACQPNLVVTKPATQVGLATMQNEMARSLKIG